MKFLFSLLPALLLACVAFAVNSLEQKFLCPVCGTHWEQRIETSGQSRGLRLDLRQLGDVVDPPTLPQCPKCRFPLFSDRLIEQAKDPAKEKAFKRLRTFVLGADFQMLAAKNPSYFALAQVQAIIGDERHPTPHRYIALSYLRASWQVEDREAACRRLLEKAREHYVAALDGMDAEDRLRGDLALLCGEIERRLEKWDDAEKRFRELESSGFLKGTPQAAIPAIQINLIARRDSAPHTLEGGEIAMNHPVPERAVKFESPGNISVASNRVEMPDAVKLEPPPKAPDMEVPAVFFTLPEPSLKLPSAPSEKPEAGLMIGLPPTALQRAPVEKPDAVVKLVSPPKAPEMLPPTEPPKPPVPPKKPDSSPLEKPDIVAKPVSLPKAPEKLPPATPVKLPLPPVKPDSNFSDNPD